LTDREALTPDSDRIFLEMKRKKCSSNLQETVSKKAKNDERVPEFYQNICEIFNIEPKMLDEVEEYQNEHFNEDQESNLINLLK
jgi:hypothetical protein